MYLLEVFTFILTRIHFKLNVLFFIFLFLFLLGYVSLEIMNMKTSLQEVRIAVLPPPQRECRARKYQFETR